ncbi:hypothetical protein [Picrophilus oshimae]|uniref:Dinitrogenase iron-molybdenum cofactor biosynthesis domain-containing protein n=1 Tax=Picrophilus torridus (strain ATCC 700027 / DSM 9790 / JCM 10055 / NBRC 100828 / KAW 2/3) TaxID=1122961 RepID=Q6L1P1_PICTO|nr:hypothetical protein [Picrophilus oshimae]AAT43111.1 hypothetical protein PTO0526 [Picrophilus oshimae DSM 9789]SMD30581.1 hypothetical protein SAMN02745355_0470 [Picrophilus oshimae DSM 9789]
MKIACVVDEENVLAPLQFGSTIFLIDSETKQIEEYENPGFGSMHGGREMAMAAILSLKPDIFIVTPNSLCPGSYSMSLGNVKYAVMDEVNISDVIKNIDKIEKSAVSELEPIMYRE